MDIHATRRRQAGFTLVELVVATALVGVLAATALPAYAKLQADARAAVLLSARSSLSTVVLTAHARHLIDGQARSGVAIRNGYPAADAALAAAAGFVTDDGRADWQVRIDGARMVAAPPGVHDAARCYISYREAPSPGAAPVIVAVTADCS